MQISLNFSTIIVLSYHIFRNAGGTSNECCYDDNDILIFGSPTGGSVKKVSIVGSTGLNYFTDLINHQFEDVLPFIHCCKGTLPNCRAYYDRRPSDNGNAYVPPQPGKVTINIKTIILYMC